MKLLLFFVLRLFKGEIWVIDNVWILDYYFFLVRLLKENINRKKYVYDVRINMIVCG